MLEVARRKWRRVVIVSTSAALLVFGVVMADRWIASVEDRDVEERVQRLHEMIRVGMDIDESVNTLRAAGFTIAEEKYLPTVRRDYYMASVLVRPRMPITEYIRRALAMKSGVSRYYVVIKADLRGTITEIH